MVESIEVSFLPPCNWCFGGEHPSYMCPAHTAYYTRCNRQVDLKQKIGEGRMLRPLQKGCFGLWSTSHNHKRGPKDFREVEYAQYSSD